MTKVFVLGKQRIEEADFPQKGFVWDESPIRVDFLASSRQVLHGSLVVTIGGYVLHSRSEAMALDPGDLASWKFELPRKPPSVPEPE